MPSLRMLQQRLREAASQPFSVGLLHRTTCHQDSATHAARVKSPQHSLVHNRRRHATGCHKLRHGSVTRHHQPSKEAHRVRKELALRALP
jgi:hypothetical protein